MHRQITGILFDISGVLVELDGVPSMAKMLRVDPEHESLHRIWLTSPSVLAHETGKIDAATFAAGVVADLRLPVTPETFLLEFESWPQRTMPGALQLLDEIPEDYRLAALSNTCALHWEKIEAMGFIHKFEQLYLSHQIGYMKPDTEAFEVALEGMGLTPSEVLFLDDGLRNVEAAQSLGMIAHLTKGPAEVRRILALYGIVS